MTLGKSLRQANWKQARPFTSLSETVAADESVASPTLPANNQESGSGVEKNTSGGYETPEETC